MRFMTLKKQFVCGCLITVAMFVILSGCSQQELQKLRSENEMLRNKVASLEQEIAKLKETADYHYKQGINFLSSQRYEEAKKEFEIVIEKYPNSSLVPSAKQQLAKATTALTALTAQKALGEIQRQEDEKYRLRAPHEAIEEWKRFRSNEDKYKGTVTTWRFQVAHISRGNPIGYLDKAAGLRTSDYTVAVAGVNILADTYEGAMIIENFPRVKEEDWIEVSGKFAYVSTDNVIALQPIRVKNLGYYK